MNADAVLAGGPLDGRVMSVDDAQDELVVTMEDGSLHGYVRDDQTTVGVPVRFSWTGRARP